MLEHCIREDLDRNAPRAMCVLRPLKVTLSNYPEHRSETLQLACHPKETSMGMRELPFERELYIDASDFEKCRRHSTSGSVQGRRFVCAAPM